MNTVNMPVVVDVVFGPYERFDVRRDTATVIDVRPSRTAVLAEFSDGTVEFLLSYYPDDLKFNRFLLFDREDFLGKTHAEIRCMYFELEDYLYRCKSKTITALYI